MQMNVSYTLVPTSHIYMHRLSFSDSASVLADKCTDWSGETRQDVLWLVAIFRMLHW